MSNRHQELASPEQTATGKDFSNPLIVDSLLKTIWSSMHHVFTMKHWLVQSKRLLCRVSSDNRFSQSKSHLLCTHQEARGLCFPLSNNCGAVCLMAHLLMIKGRRQVINATIDGHSLSITEGFLYGEIKWLIKMVLLLFQLQRSLSNCPKKTAWEQFSSNIAAAVICLATNRKIGVLEDDLMKTKQTYSSAYTKLYSSGQKLGLLQIKIGKARRQARVVLSDDEVIEDDSSKQGRKLSDEEQGSKKASDEVSTAGAKKGTTAEEVTIVSTAEVDISTAGGNCKPSRRSAREKSKTR
ncbi:hypothetical protein Tco_1448079 [Tanacetum coccineum]